MCLNSRFESRDQWEELIPDEFVCYKKLDKSGSDLVSPAYTHKVWKPGEMVASGQSRRNGDSGIYVFLVAPGTKVRISASRVVRMTAKKSDVVWAGRDKWDGHDGICLVMKRVSISPEDYALAADDQRHEMEIEREIVKTKKTIKTAKKKAKATKKVATKKATKVAKRAKKVATKTSAKTKKTAKKVLTAAKKAVKKTTTKVTAAAKRGVKAAKKAKRKTGKYYDAENRETVSKADLMAQAGELEIRGRARMNMTELKKAIAAETRKRERAIVSAARKAAKSKPSTKKETLAKTEARKLVKASKRKPAAKKATRRK